MADDKFEWRLSRRAGQLDREQDRCRDAYVEMRSEAEAQVTRVRRNGP